MRKREFVLTYDVGTTAIKTCLYELKETIQLVASQSEGYGLYFKEKSGIEQEPNEWWHAMIVTTQKIMAESPIEAKDVIGISFCAQMQGLVLVDEEGEPVRPAMSYLDSRGEDQLAKVFGTGPKFEGVNIIKLIRSIAITGVAATSVKDPIWKYLWVKEHEPEVFERVHKWLDVKEFLVAKATGTFCMTQDSAYASMLFNIRERTFSSSISRMFGVWPSHLPQIVSSTEAIGNLSVKAAKELGLSQETKVYAGGGDATLLGVGAGATVIGDTHIYLGTSGWVSTVVKKPLLDVSNRIAGIVGANPKSYNYFAELETAGKCVEWVRDHLAFDEFTDYMRTQHNQSPESVKVNLYNYMMEAIAEVPAGSNGVLFAPWLHGNRSPFEDPNAKGLFFNLGLTNGKRDMIHAVIEGVCFHLKWQLEASEKKAKTSSVIRLVGGGALAPHTCQTLSDVLGRPIEVVKEPQNAGALGAVILVAVAIGRIDNLEAAKQLIEVVARYEPEEQLIAFYEERFEVFKGLYRNNKQAFMILNKV